MPLDDQTRSVPSPPPDANISLSRLSRQLMNLKIRSEKIRKIARELCVCQAKSVDHIRFVNSRNPYFFITVASDNKSLIIMQHLYKTCIYTTNLHPKIPCTSPSKHVPSRGHRRPPQHRTFKNINTVRRSPSTYRYRRICPRSISIWSFLRFGYKTSASPPSYHTPPPSKPFSSPHTLKSALIFQTNHDFFSTHSPSISWRTLNSLSLLA